MLSGAAVRIAVESPVPEDVVLIRERALSHVEGSSRSGRAQSRLLLCCCLLLDRAKRTVFGQLLLTGEDPSGGERSPGMPWWSALSPGAIGSLLGWAREGCE